MTKYIKMSLTGLLIAVLSLMLVAFGNPANMGACIACFLRDTAGALGFHSAAVVQYVRPEIIGIIIGAFIMSIIGKEFSTKGGSSPITRFILGICVMIGALVFLGCPLRMVLRIGGGDLNAIVGLAGFVVGIVIGIFFLNRGFSLKRTYTLTKFEGYALPALSVGLLAILLFIPGLLVFSTEGPGSAHAPIAIALIAGLIIGVIGQKVRLCFVGGIRDSILFKDFTMLIPFIAIIMVTIIGNLILGNFKLGFQGQPIAHTDGLWNFLGLTAVGFGSTLLGGCPLRQLVLAGAGNSDSTVTIIGLIVGAAIAHNFKLASSGDGATANGKIAVIIVIIIIALIAVLNTKSKKEEVKA